MSKKISKQDRHTKKQKKNITVHFRLTEAEKCDLERRSTKCSMCISEYLRKIVFGQKLKKEVKAEISELVTRCQDLVTYVEERYWCAEDQELEERMNGVWEML